MENKRESLVGSRPEIIATFLVPFFQRLDNAGICWAISHGAEGLPYYTRHDVDIEVEDKKVRLAFNIAKKTAADTGWKIFGTYSANRMKSCWMLFDDGREISLLTIDIGGFSGLRNIPMFGYDESVRLKYREKNERGIWVLPKAQGAAIVLVKELLAKGALMGEQRHEQVYQGAKEDTALFEELVRLAVKNKKTTREIVDLCLNKRWDDLSCYAKWVRRGVYSFDLRHIPRLIRWLIDYVKSLTFPYLRLFVAFVGPDGCGKSTVIDGLIRRFNLRPFYSCRVIHSHFGNAVRLRDIYCTLMRLFGKKVHIEAPPPPGTKGCGMHTPMPLFKSMFYITYYGLSLMLGRLWLLRWRSYSSLLIADRYFYDYYISISHIKTPIWYKKLIEFIVPKPDIIISLERDAKEIYRQKPELDISEIEREQSVIRKIFENDRRAVIIDASHGKEHAISEAINIVESWLKDKCR